MPTTLARKLTMPLRVLRLPAYSPDFNPDEAIWAWAREEVRLTRTGCAVADRGTWG